ncbi:MAG: sigma-54-dependent Fis family transcriptional regulator [Bacteroidetes bacterium GWF2_49_14]|nr:MAG: sigma-54-dependent Fis family transcriptional regulator [Bacteroidetes bacterium GWF2_49_14]HBB92661.1 sigma-54-dependent Fis family transcriptional regulator [Bacteroidales bacterium]
MTTPLRILVCDDDLAIRSSLSFLLTKAGYEVESAATPEEIILKVRQQEFSLVVLDMNFSLTITGDEGLELLQKIRLLKPQCPVILITAWGSVELAVKGIKLGAADFITKPWNNLQLLKIIGTSIALAGSQGPHKDSGDTRHRDPGFPGIIGRDPKMLDILDVVRRVAPTDAPVLISGESGTGKELIAGALHQLSNRSKGPFVKVNLGGLPSSLFEAEMFGHIKGAFTDALADRTGRFEMAHKGTIFLDEIGELDLTSQVKLLRVLQDQTFERLGDSHTIGVDVRVITASNRNLVRQVAQGLFREDLLYRINLIQIELPPLRQRRSDIPLLAAHFAEKAAESFKIPGKQISAEGMDWLCQQPWPGNIRELRNMTERTVLLSAGEVIQAGDFEAASRSGNQPVTISPQPMGPVKTLEETEKDMILHALADFGDNLTKVAGKLGISRTTLYRKMEKYGIHAGHEE